MSASTAQATEPAAAPPKRKPAKQRVNPNASASTEQLDARKAAEEAQAIIEGNDERLGLPHDPEALKDLVLKARRDGRKALDEVEELRNDLAKAAPKARNFDEVSKRLKHELSATAGKWRYALGYQDEDQGVEGEVAPIGDGGKVSLVAMMFFLKGELVHVTVTSEKMSIVDDGHGRWKLK